MKRVVACALALCLTVCLFAGTASAAAREPISKFTIPLADNVNLIEMTHAGGIFSETRRMFCSSTRLHISPAAMCDRW